MMTRMNALIITVETHKYFSLSLMVYLLPLYVERPDLPETVLSWKSTTPSWGQNLFVLSLFFLYDRSSVEYPLSCKRCLSLLNKFWSFLRFDFIINSNIPGLLLHSIIVRLSSQNLKYGGVPQTSLSPTPLVSIFLPVVFWVWTAQLSLHCLRSISTISDLLPMTSFPFVTLISVSLLIVIFIVFCRENLIEIMCCEAGT